MDFTVLRDVTRQRSDISRDEFLQLTVVYDKAYYLMLLLESHQHLFGSRILTGFGLFGFRIEFEFLEQQFAYLLRAIDIKGLFGQRIDTLLEGFEFSRKGRLRLFEFSHIDPYACCFHLTQYLYQRQFNLVVQVPQIGIGLECLPVRLFVGIESHFWIQQILTEAVLDGIESRRTLRILSTRIFSEAEEI